MSVIARGRSLARRQMRDLVDVARPTGDYDIDEQGRRTHARTIVHSDIPAMIRVLMQQSRIVDAAGKPVTFLAYEVLLPVTVGDIRPDDLIIAKRSRSVDLPGRTLPVVDTPWGTHQVARRLICEAQL